MRNNEIERIKDLKTLFIEGTPVGYEAIIITRSKPRRGETEAKEYRRTAQELLHILTGYMENGTYNALVKMILARELKETKKSLKWHQRN